MRYTKKGGFPRSNRIPGVAIVDPGSSYGALFPVTRTLSPSAHEDISSGLGWNVVEIEQEKQITCPWVEVALLNPTERRGCEIQSALGEKILNTPETPVPSRALAS